MHSLKKSLERIQGQKLKEKRIWLNKKKEVPPKDAVAASDEMFPGAAVSDADN
jgi:hypothetical protein